MEIENKITTKQEPKTWENSDTQVIIRVKTLQKTQICKRTQIRTQQTNERTPTTKPTPPQTLNQNTRSFNSITTYKYTQTPQQTHRYEPYNKPYYTNNKNNSNTNKIADQQNTNRCNKINTINSPNWNNNNSGDKHHNNTKTCN